MKSEPRQFCRDIILSIERYSKSTASKVIDMLTTHDRVIQIEKLIDMELPEEEFIAELNKLDNEVK